MAIKHSPGCRCCGSCVTLEHTLYPDFYSPVTVVCFVRERTITTTTIGDADPVVDTGDWTETTDEELIAGKWAWDYPEATVGDTTTQITIEEERRLALQFDLSDQFSFGQTNRDSEAVLVSSHLKLVCRRYRRDGFPVPVDIGQVDEVRISGVLYNETMPADRSEFDTLVAAAANTTDVTGFASPTTQADRYATLTDWLATEAKSTGLILLDSPDDDTGLTFDLVKWSISDRTLSNSGADLEYDWQNDWTRTAAHKMVGTFDVSDFDKRFDFSDTLAEMIDGYKVYDLVYDKDNSVQMPELKVTIEGVTEPIYFRYTVTDWRSEKSNPLRLDRNMAEALPIYQEIALTWATDQAPYQPIVFNVALVCEYDTQTLILGEATLSYNEVTGNSFVNPELQTLLSDAITPNAIVEIGKKYLAIGSTGQSRIEGDDEPTTNTIYPAFSVLNPATLSATYETATSVNKSRIAIESFSGASELAEFDLTVETIPNYRILGKVEIKEIANLFPSESDPCPDRICPATTQPGPIVDVSVSLDASELSFETKSASACTFTTSRGFDVLSTFRGGNSQFVGYYNQKNVDSEVNTWYRFRKPENSYSYTLPKVQIRPAEWLIDDIYASFQSYTDPFSFFEKLDRDEIVALYDLPDNTGQVITNKLYFHRSLTLPILGYNSLTVTPSINELVSGNSTTVFYSYGSPEDFHFYRDDEPQYTASASLADAVQDDVGESDDPKDFVVINCTLTIPYLAPSDQMNGPGKIVDFEYDYHVDPFDDPDNLYIQIDGYIAASYSLGEDENRATRGYIAYPNELSFHSSTYSSHISYYEEGNTWIELEMARYRTASITYKKVVARSALGASHTLTSTDITADSGWTSGEIERANRVMMTRVQVTVSAHPGLKPLDIPEINISPSTKPLRPNGDESVSRDSIKADVAYWLETIARDDFSITVTTS